MSDYSDNDSDIDSDTSSVEEEEDQEIEEPEEQITVEPDNDEEDNIEIDGGAGSDEDNNNSDNDDDGPSAINPLAPTFDSDDEDEDVTEEGYLQKFNTSINKNYISDYHPECSINNYEEIAALTVIIRDTANNIIDDLHRTLPYLTKYERARVLGQRAKQINSGAKVFVKVPENVIDGYLIAELELSQKRIPFIIRRPVPGGGCEYWNLKDLELIQF